jgi:ferric-dicitrate binding protein FerR (iron transport regulator)
MQHEKQLLKWLDGRISEAELSALQETAEYKALAPIIAHTDNFKKPTLDVAAALKNFDALKQNAAKQQPKVIAFRPWKQLTAIAASLLLVASLYMVFTTSNTAISTQYAETKIFNLPDASEVALNSGSTIEYSEKKWKEKRELSLEGEAYFKVSKGNVFDVRTKQGTVTVVGTQFNVHERDGLFEVVCYEGKVKVSIAEETVMLSPGQGVHLINGSLNKIDAIAEALPDWLQDESTFKAVPFKQVVAELERQYNISLSYDAKLEDKAFTGSFGHNKLETAIEAIGFPMNLKYKKLSDNSYKLYEE